MKVLAATAGAIAAIAVLLPSAAVTAVAGRDGSGRDGGEIWVTAQDASRIHVVHGLGSVDTIQLPFGTSPHFARLSPSGKYVYVPSLGYGTVTVIRAHDRDVVTTIPLAPAIPGPPFNSNPKLPGGLGTHDAKPSPDGSFLLAAQWSNKSLYKIAADEASETWFIDDVLPMPRVPICIVFHPSAQRAYVGTQPNGISVIDLATLAEVKTLPTTGAWSCSWAQTRDGSTMYLSTNASPGFLYRLDMQTDELTNLGLPLGSPHIHGLGLSRDEKTIYLTSREDDSLRIVSLADGSVETVSLDVTPGVPDRPDAVAVEGDNVWISLRSSGKLVRFKANQRTYELVDLEPVCPADESLCYAIHGVDVRY